MEKERVEFIRQLTEEILTRLKVAASVSVVTEEEQVKVEVSSPELGLIIGYHGEGLLGLQLILNLAFYNRFGEWVGILVDAGGYRQEREEKIKRLAQWAVDKARFLSRAVALPPMPAFERRVAHLAVAREDDVFSESSGEGQERHVVVKLKEAGEE